MSICAKCQLVGCTHKDENKMPKKLCPTINKDLQEKARTLYVDEDFEIEKNSTLVEEEGNCNLTRVEEIILFVKKMNYTHVGVAFCMGLHKEANIFVKILENNGLKVSSVGCKNGANLKSFVGIPKEEKETYIKNDMMCNPIGQALVLNNENTELNILLGLCVGHDTLFLKYSEAPTTVFAVKDRVLCHNPLGAIYQSEGYYKKKLFKK